MDYFLCSRKLLLEEYTILCKVYLGLLFKILYTNAQRISAEKKSVPLGLDLVDAIYISFRKIAIYDNGCGREKRNRKMETRWGIFYLFCSAFFLNIATKDC